MRMKAAQMKWLKEQQAHLERLQQGAVKVQRASSYLRSLSSQLFVPSFGQYHFFIHIHNHHKISDSLIHSLLCWLHAMEIKYIYMYVFMHLFIYDFALLCSSAVAEKEKLIEDLEAEAAAAVAMEEEEGSGGAKDKK